MFREVTFSPTSGRQRRVREAWAQIAELAALQHGVIARFQLISLGLRESAIDHCLQASQLHLVHRGVYALGHSRLSRRGHWLAAVLAAGPGAVLSHRFAAASWNLVAPPSGRIEVTAPRRLKPNERYLAHHSLLPDDEITVVDGIPVTTVNRTLMDLAARSTLQQLERAFAERDIQGLHDPVAIEKLLRRHPGRRGNKRLRAIESRRRVGDGVTKRELEAKWVEFVEEAGYESVELNARVEAGGQWWEVDSVWRARKLIVELDSRKYHGHDIAFQGDRRRDRILLTAGYRSVRVTWQMLVDRRMRSELHRDFKRLLTDNADPRSSH